VKSGASNDELREQRKNRGRCQQDDRGSPPRMPPLFHRLAKSDSAQRCANKEKNDERDCRHSGPQSEEFTRGRFSNPHRQVPEHGYSIGAQGYQHTEWDRQSEGW
jgi:hypothetical protein